MIDVSLLAIYNHYAINSMVSNSNQDFEKWRLISVTFCLVCCFKCCEVCEMKLQLIVLTTNGTYGSGSLANSLGRASKLHVRALTCMLPQQ